MGGGTDGSAHQIAFFLRELESEEPGRRAAAVKGLGRLGRGTSTARSSPAWPGMPRPPYARERPTRWGGSGAMRRARWSSR